MLFGIALLILSTLLFAEEMVLDTYIAGKYTGTFLYEKCGDDLISIDHTVRFGGHRFSSIKELAERYRIVDEKLIVYPKKKYLPNFSEKQRMDFAKNNSFFLNYAFQKSTKSVLDLSAGVFYKGFYTYANLRDFRWFVLKNMNDFGIEVGDIFGVTDSVLIGGKTIRQGLRFYSFDPLMRRMRKFNYQLTIFAPSRVDIYDNGVLLLSRVYEPGIYDLDELPLRFASNRLEIVIEDIYGNKRVKSIDFINIPSLLQKGASEYSWALGKRGDVFGYLRYGIDDRINVRASIGGANGSISIETGGELGVGGVEVATDGSYRMFFSTLLSRLNCSFSYTKKRDRDFRFQTKWFDKEWGSISTLYHLNGSEFLTLDYSKSFGKFFLQANLRLGEEKRFYLGFSIPFHMKKKSSILRLRAGDRSSSYVQFSSAIDESKSTDYGLFAQVSDQGAMVRTELRYYNDFFFEKNGGISKFVWRGSVGCVKSDELICGIGEILSSRSAFSIDENYFIRREVPYFMKKFETSGLSEEKALLFGQGFSLMAVSMKNVTGKILVEGVPMTNKIFKVDGKEYFTGLDGMFWVEGFRKELEDFVVDVDGHSCVTGPFVNRDKRVFETTIECRRKK